MGILRGFLNRSSLVSFIAQTSESHAYRVDLASSIEASRMTCGALQRQKKGVTRE